MTVEKVLELGIVDDSTNVYIRDKDMNTLAKGNWYEDGILHYLNEQVESFTWQDDDYFYIDLKEV